MDALRFRARLAMGWSVHAPAFATTQGASFEDQTKLTL